MKMSKPTSVKKPTPMVKKKPTATSMVKQMPTMKNGGKKC